MALQSGEFVNEVAANRAFGKHARTDLRQRWCNGLLARLAEHHAAERQRLKLAAASARSGRWYQGLSPEARTDRHLKFTRSWAQSLRPDDECQYDKPTLEPIGTPRRTGLRAVGGAAGGAPRARPARGAPRERPAEDRPQRAAQPVQRFVAGAANGIVGAAAGAKSCPSSWLGPSAH